MIVVKKSQIVGYSCEQMYNLVNDIERYPEFLPYFSKTIIHHKDADSIQATSVISAAGVSKSFTTHNLLQANKMIEMRLVDGPFSHLEGFWRFDEVPEGCHISFDLEFEFISRMFAMMLGPIFEQITGKLVDAFCERAHSLYSHATTA